MRTPEGKVKDAVKKLLNMYKAWYYMPVSYGYGRVGIPDFLCCLNGYFFAIETKAPGKNKLLTPNQIKEIHAILEVGAVAITVDDASIVKELLEKIKCLNPPNINLPIRNDTTPARKISKNGK